VSHELIKNGYSITGSSPDGQRRRSDFFSISLSGKTKKTNKKLQPPVETSLNHLFFVPPFWFIFFLLVQTEKNDSCQTPELRDPKLGSRVSPAAGAQEKQFFFLSPSGRSIDKDKKNEQTLMYRYSS
jgi:hypothetical protein